MNSDVLLEIEIKQEPDDEDENEIIILGENNVSSNALKSVLFLL